MTFVDSVKVYSKSKDAFSWSEEEAAQVNSQTEQQTLALATRKAPAAAPSSEEQDTEDVSESDDMEHVESAQSATPADR